MKNIAEWYLELRDPIYNYLCYLTNDPDLAQELTQETFYQALISITRFRQDSSFKTWLYSIARNTYLREHKKRVKEMRRQTEFSEQINSNSHSPNHADLRRQTDPLARLIADETYRQYLELISLLPETYRTVFILKELEDWSYRDLAQFLNKTENWARVTYFRAKQQLKESLERISKTKGGDKP